MNLKNVIKAIKLLPNTIYWLINIPFGVIVINSWLTQRWNKVQPNNIGDDINYFLVRELSGKKVINYRNIIHKRLRIKNILCIGSIVDWMTNEQSIIWGSGVLYGYENRMKKSPQKVCAVRGPLTREYLLNHGIDCPEIYGDPALLLPLIYKSNSPKKYKIGIIPHFYDYNLVKLKNVLSSKLINYTIIDISWYENWKKVIDEINECEIIASSSLHGLIISDAYRIPNVWIQLSDNMKGGNFKFFDYLESVGRDGLSPLDLRDSKIIDCNEIIHESLKYKPPKFSEKNLLEACPFKVKEKYYRYLSNAK